MTIPCTGILNQWSVTAVIIPEGNEKQKTQLKRFRYKTNAKCNFTLYNRKSLRFSYGTFWYTYQTFFPLNTINCHSYHSDQVQNNVH